MNELWNDASRRIRKTEALQTHREMLLYNMATDRTGELDDHYNWIATAPVEEILMEVEVWVEETTDMAYYLEDDGDSEAWAQAQGQAALGRSNPNPYGFRDPGGRSSLRIGAQVYACPTCKEPDKLSMADKNLGYQCDDCADRVEGRLPG